jgi:ATP-dependent helicase/nuclease subunit A
MDFDIDQQAAYAIDSNAAVSAGAGSGKTTVLAERYVRLVTERGFKVNEVLTLTFTRKAAAEMRDRIFKRLSVSEHPAAADALAQFDKARIATLDSFCSGLIRGASYHYGVASDFRVDSGELRRVAEEAAVEIIMRERKNPAISRLVSARSFKIAIEDLFASLALSVFSLVEPGTYAVKAENQVQFIEMETQKRSRAINDCCAALLAICDSNEGAKSKAAAVREVKAACNKTIPFPLLLDKEHRGKEESAVLIETLIARAVFFATSQSFKTPSSNVKDPVLVELREQAIILKENAEKLRILAETLSFRGDTLAIGEILDEYEKLFLSRKRQIGLLSFNDTLLMTVDVLKNDIGLRSYYKKHIKAIMIDEFKENNEQQKNLLYLLAEQDDIGSAGRQTEARDIAPDKLFFVGDGKQSIYRFRGADVAVFNKLSDELHNEPIALSTNYRSARALVNFFNAVFPAVFGEAVESYEVDYSPVRYNPLKAPSNVQAVEIHLQEKGESGGAISATTASEVLDAREAKTAEAVSNGMSEALAAAERIMAGVTSAPQEFRFGDIAVLFRSTSHQNEYERVFRECGIPFTAADPRGVYAEGPANDFYAILRLSLFPMDSNAYATVLRSPFAKLGDDAVFRLLLKMDAESETELPAVFPEEADSLFATSADKFRYEHIKRVFSELKRRIDLEPIASILSFLWYETGYRTSLLYNKDASPNIEHFDYLYNLALDADQRQLSVGAFLDELSPLIGTTKKMETGEVPEVNDEVLFLTVHKSKGLEFDTVILANADSKGQGDVNNKPYYLSREYGPIINIKPDTKEQNKSAVNYFYEMAKEDTQKQEEAELKRLFYVAATRAKKRLFIFGTRTITKNDNLEGFEGEERLERLRTLVKLPRFSGTGKDKKLQKKSFLDLLAIGIGGDAAGLTDGERSEYGIFPIETPNKAEYWKRMDALREKTSKKTARVTLMPEPFYRMEGNPLPERRIILRSPTLMEGFDADKNKLEPARGGIDNLPPFRCDNIIGDDEKSSFGTLCHRVIEMLLTNGEGGANDKINAAAVSEARSLFPDIDKKKAQMLSDEALELASAFLDSSLGKEAAASLYRRSEFPFILPLSGKDRRTVVLVQGKIDLIYEYNGLCTIIDFKTDMQARPENHRVQLACYKAASSAFSPLPPRTMLLYLRNMEAHLFDPKLSMEEVYKVGANSTINPAKSF